MNYFGVISYLQSLDSILVFHRNIDEQANKDDKWGLDKEKNLPCVIVKTVNSDEGIFPLYKLNWTY